MYQLERERKKEKERKRKKEKERERKREIQEHMSAIHIFLSILALNSDSFKHVLIYLHDIEQTMP